MILPVVLYGDPILRKKGRKADPTDPATAALAADMIETMHAFEGVGLAAQQIGKDLLLCVIDVAGITERPSKIWIGDIEQNIDDLMPMILINPAITSATKKKVIENEGCLSFPEVGGKISRAFRISVEAQQTDGSTIHFDAGGLLGRAIQHELDHLDGILFIDHFENEDRRKNREKLGEIKATRPSLRMPETKESE